MAKIKILGDSFTMTSEIAFQNIENLKKFKPAALKMVDEKTKEELFAIGTGSTPSATKFGVIFTNKDASGKATVTIALPAGMEAEARAEYVKDTYGAAILNLNKIENKLETEVVDFEQAMLEVESSVEVL